MMRMKDDNRNILILTSIYPAPDLEAENTAVVHYFVREWVRLGYNVRVVHFPANFPKLIMSGASFFKKILSSKFGATIRTKQASPIEYMIDGVKVLRVPLMKFWPHGRYSSTEISKAYQKTVKWLTRESFFPDFITSHWVNPQLEIMVRLKDKYQSKTCYIAHTPTCELTNIYSLNDINKLFSAIDLVGFRSAYIKNSFLSSFQYSGPTFQCYSGIPEKYIPSQRIKKTFKEVHDFIFVGTLIKRKYPAEIIPALVKAFDKGSFNIYYIGQGAEEKKIYTYAKKNGVLERVHLLGRLSRDNVVSYLQKCDVFVMISRSEAYGLVYLEAMSQGCITIASKNEGFDGIIVDGKNGFLCESGNVDDLARTIKRIITMSAEELREISNNAFLTAKKLTDSSAAQYYLYHLSNT